MIVKSKLANLNLVWSDTKIIFILILDLSGNLIIKSLARRQVRINKQEPRDQPFLILGSAGPTSSSLEPDNSSSLRFSSAKSSKSDGSSSFKKSKNSFCLVFFSLSSSRSVSDPSMLDFSFIDVN